VRILLLHRTFPGQFLYLASALVQERKHRVIFGTASPNGTLPGVEKQLYGPVAKAHSKTHHYAQSLEGAVLEAQATWRLGQRLQEEGFVPDLVYGHSGWGPTLFIKDLFPQTKLVCYFEWFYRAHGGSHNFDPTRKLGPDAEAEVRTKNAPILIDLEACDAGLAPTRWQQSQFPVEFRNKIKVLHDGIPTGIVRPRSGARLVLPEIGLDLGDVEELVTYVATGMEPMRGFPQFMEAVSLLQRRRPRCHVVVVGEDRTEYSNPAPEGRTYRELMLERFEYDHTRLHFVGRRPYGDYLQVLQASGVHVYLSYPYILSWSLLEAMAAGCLVVGSDTPPVTEMVREGFNGLLVDFFAPEQLAERIGEVFEHPDRMAALRDRARLTVVERYALDKLLPRQIGWLEGIVRA
jgi:glycosyltransferase involved in cell wall biosynthesis